MIGKRKTEVTLFDVGNVWPFAPNPKSYYGQLAAVSDRLFVDDDFALLYSDKRGRPSTPPSLLALVLLMQSYEGISDEEAIERTACDLRWAAVLRRIAGTALCAKSTLQLFRAHLLLHEAYMMLLQRSLSEARKKGLLKGHHLAAAVDTKPILGRGAVEDTFNLLATAMVQLARAIAQTRKETLPVFVMRHGFHRLDEPSIKGSFDIDWSDEAARDAVLTELVAEARRLMAMADGSNPQVKKAADLLEQLLLQDIAEEPSDKGRPVAHLKKGTARGRIPSATDPQQRHGRKSKSKRFTGSKASVAVDVQSGLILATDVLAGDAADATDVLPLIDQAQINSEATINETIGDCAYGDGATRQAFEDAGRKLIAKVPTASVSSDFFPKSAFRIELPVEGRSLEFTKVTCPGGAVADRLTVQADGGVTFYFDEFCSGCSLRSRCTHSRHGRSLHIHAQERLLQEAHKLQATPDGRAKLRRRLTVENSFARLSHLGIGQARYVGRAKTAFQLAIAATVANLRRTWNWAEPDLQANHEGLAPTFG
jgi:hypothetical protein